jgi:glutamine---fructose-6-phosphate transaminase (isomerizing)
MCGIIGYTGNRVAAPVIKKGLETLEYRGYDSCGVLVVNGKMEMKKNIGKIKEVFIDDEFLSAEGSLGIGHTRWATHGGVTKENAHPHISNNGKIGVVHNGIIENYQKLRDFLKGEGFSFESETDSEIIPNLVEYNMKELDFLGAVKKTLRMLEGAYALVIVSLDEKLLVGARKESPLVLGVGDGEYFIASDIPAFLEYTKNVIYLEDGDVVVLNHKMHIYNLFQDKEVERPVSTVAWDVEQAKKGDFDHFMLKEINEQAEVINKSINQNVEVLNNVADEIKKANNVYFVGCGTAYHAGMMGCSFFSRIAKIDCEAHLGSEFLTKAGLVKEGDVVIAVSQSGETADTLEAVREAKKRGAKIISIVNVMGSSLVRESDLTILQNAGPEICVLSTKSYTSQLSILVLLTYALLGKIDEGKSVLKEIILYIYYLTSWRMRLQLRNLAGRLKDVHHIYLIGRGFQYPTAMEAALKIKEVSYIHAEGFAGGELKHGSIALIEEGTPCIVFTSKDTENKIVSNAMELKARGAYIVGIGPKENEVFDYFIKVRESDISNSICQIIPVQILAYQLALLRGCDPDKPRNLAKSVTVK